MAQNEEQRILDIQVKYEDAINGIVEYKKKIDELKDAEKSLSAQFKEGSITEEEYRKGVVASQEAQKDYKNVVRELLFRRRCRITSSTRRRQRAVCVV